MENLLTESLWSVVKNFLPLEKLNELRLRVGLPIVAVLGGKPYYLGLKGLSGSQADAIICDSNMLMDIVKRASEHSLYAVNHQLKQGFITVLGGIRVGICGEVVIENHRVKTIKNFTGLNIRIPHQVKNCSLNVFGFLMQSKFLNTLIISPPGCGKTTFIRDVLWQLSEHNYCYNVLLVDERYEIANCLNGKPQLDVGKFTDVYSGCNKLYGFENGVRSMRPDIVATDELANEADVNALSYVACCGVGVLSSVHASDVEDLKNKPAFEKLLQNKIFKRYVVLSNKKGPGTVEAVYDENLRGIAI